MKLSKKARITEKTTVAVNAENCRKQQATSGFLHMHHALVLNVPTYCVSSDITNVHP